MEVVHLKLEAEIEHKTAGLTDTQIKAYGLGQMESNISSCLKGIAIMEQNIEDEKARLRDLRAVKARKLELCPWLQTQTNSAKER